MPRFNYIAIDSGGKKSKGTITAESDYVARKQLRTRGIHPTKITESKISVQSFGNFRFKSNKNTLIDFTKQMSTLLNSGIKLTESLSVLSIQTNDLRFRNALTDIRDRVISGESFTDAISDYDDYFDIMYVSMVKVGEITGSIAANFSTIATFMEKRQRVESKIITAMIYPIVLTSFCIFAVLALTTFIIPNIAQQLIRTGQELPWITKQLMNVAYVCKSWWLLVVILIFGFIGFSYKKFVKTEKGGLMRDNLLLSLPVFGHLIKQRVVARFASTLSTLLNAGLSVADSLKIVSSTTGNMIMKRSIIQARERILSGADIATPLRDSGVINPAIAHMIAVGEKSGELEKMLKNISDDLEASTDIVIERLSTAIEPLIIIGMAFVVGVIAYATILPILELSSGKL